MAERIGISLILVVIAIAQLVTDIVRLALEATPRPSVYELAPAPTRSAEPEMPRPPPSREPAEQPRGATDWAPDRHRAVAADRTFRRLPLDFSINQPPWCPACRHQGPPRYERRRHRDDW